MYNPEDREEACDHLYDVYEKAAAEWMAQRKFNNSLIHPNNTVPYVSQPFKFWWHFSLYHNEAYEYIFFINNDSVRFVILLKVQLSANKEF